MRKLLLMFSVLLVSFCVFHIQLEPHAEELGDENNTTEEQKTMEPPSVPQYTVKLKKSDTGKRYMFINISVKGKADYYEIARADTFDGIYETIATTKKTSYKDKTIKQGQVYYYKVRACGGGQYTAWGRRTKAGYPIPGTSIQKILHYSSSSVRIFWKQQKKAEYYRVYRSTGRNGEYKPVAVTQELSYRDRGLKTGVRYYYKVQACVGRKRTVADSVLSAPCAKTTREYKRTTVFAGDSLMTGISVFRSVDRIDIGGIKKVVAYKGLGTLTFQTRSVFGGKTGLEKIIGYHPYRLYIMLGMNEIEWRSVDSMIKCYQDLIETVQSECPDTDIVILAVAPVSQKTQTKRTGFKKIPSWNKKIEKLAKKLNVRFYDYTADYTDANGCLRKEYNGGDGIHWTKTGYDYFGKLLEKYDKELEK